MMSIQDVMR